MIANKVSEALPFGLCSAVSTACTSSPTATVGLFAVRCKDPLAITEL